LPHQREIRVKKLEGKVAVVTGASKGIGAAIARHLGAAGASVVVNYASSKEGADKVVKAIQEAGSTAIAVQADVSKQADIEKLFAATEKEFGRLDVLVNNAGIYEFSPLEKISEAQLQKLFGLNVFGLILTTQEAVKYFSTEGGSIINISSVVSTMAPGTSSLYSATKGAVDTFTKSLAKELGPRNIRVNCINPGLVETEGIHASGMVVAGYPQQTLPATPLGRIGQPDDIAPAAVYFASSDSGWITGETLFITGGRR
jgi:3-oxoacyl-[acyl-carrier protein] reductase